MLVLQIEALHYIMQQMFLVIFWGFFSFFLGFFLATCCADIHTVEFACHYYGRGIGEVAYLRWGVGFTSQGKN